MWGLEIKWPIILYEWAEKTLITNTPVVSRIAYSCQIHIFLLFLAIAYPTFTNFGTATFTKNDTTIFTNFTTTTFAKIVTEGLYLSCDK